MQKLNYYHLMNEMKKDTPMMVMIDQYRQVVDEVPSGKKTSG